MASTVRGVVLPAGTPGAAHLRDHRGIAGPARVRRLAVPGPVGAPAGYRSGTVTVEATVSVPLRG
ncbi:MAG TPA: hypothetical protein VEO01_30060, partial [Pseudonocardiaceae bacterium]|nr:hypothetical protein [Pseudonocardiaceae bacterium]